MQKIECVRHLFVYEVRKIPDFRQKTICDAREYTVETISYSSFYGAKDGFFEVKKAFCEKNNISNDEFNKDFVLKEIEHTKEIVICEVEKLNTTEMRFPY